MSGKSPAKTKEVAPVVESPMAEELMANNAPHFIMLQPLQLMIPAKNILGISVAHTLTNAYELEDPLKNGNALVLPGVRNTIVLSSDVKVVFTAAHELVDDFFPEEDDEEKDEDEEEKDPDVYTSGNVTLSRYPEDSENYTPNLFVLRVANAASLDIANSSTGVMPLLSAPPVESVASISEKNALKISNKERALQQVINLLNSETSTVSAEDDVMTVAPSTVLRIADGQAMSAESRRLANVAEERRDLMNELLEFFNKILRKGSESYDFNPYTETDEHLKESAALLYAEAIPNVIVTVEGIG